MARESKKFPNLIIVDHPLVQHKLTLMRMKTTTRGDFRQLLKEIGMLMTYELTRDYKTHSVNIETPVAKMKGEVLSGKKTTVVPILRAGLAMADGVMEIMPRARMGQIGLYRDQETRRPVEYMVKLPPVENRRFILVDPMLATGGSAAHAARILTTHGVASHDIQFMALVSAPEGVREFHTKHPDIVVYTAALDEKLNEKAYIVPGLGDAGDRIYGT